ncbi:MAG: site-specific DNA-methyltransferase [Methylococcales bacterium]|nr:site-specific DNA-methyltransferase [Methylococcales bacterium]
MKENKMPNTPDVQQERLQELKRLFPDLFDGEGRLKLDDLKQLAGEPSQHKERYDFTWSGKRNAKQAAYSPTTAALTYDETRSVNPDKAGGNLIIEGENLESLKCLLAAYRGVIKCIYIDPPYNTGKDFVYSDNYNEQRQAYWQQTGGVENGIKVDTNPDSDGRYHSNWLNMIYPRLLLARQLLKDDGVIFVSIDDNEVHNLRKVMDEVFGEENFVGKIVWKNVTDNNPTRINSEHEYILCFAKEIKNLPQAWKSFYSDAQDILQAEYDRLLIKHGDDIDLIQKNLRDFISNNTESVGFLSRYKFVDPQGVYTGSESVHNTKAGGYDFEILHPATGLPMKNPANGYRFPEATYLELQEKGVILFGEDEKRIIKIKKYLSEYLDTLRSTLVMDGRLGSYDMKRIGLGGVFSNPKPIDLFKYIVSFVTNNDSNDLIVDFFAGSGGMAQAICELNKKDQGNRKFILVQIPEQSSKDNEAGKKAISAGFKKISDITIERVKRVINGYTLKGTSSDNPQPLEAGFKVYQLTKSHFPRVDFQADPELSEAENLQRLDTYISEKEAQLIGLFEPHEIRDEVLLKNGFRLNYRLQAQPQFTANTVSLADDGEKSALICLDNTLSNKTVEQLLQAPQAFICLERALNTDAKWNLRQHLKHLFIAF